VIEIKNSEKVLSYGLLLNIAGLILSFIFGFWGDQKHVLRIGYQVWSYLFSNDNSFNDFFGDRVESLGNYCIYLQCQQYDVTSPPMALILGKFFYFIPEEASLIVFVLLNITISLFLLTYYFEINLKFSIYFLLSSFPLFFAIFRGNNDLYLLPGLLFVILSQFKNKPVISAIGLGVLSGIEPIMILYIVILFKYNSKLRYVFYCFITYLFVWISPILHGEKNLFSYFSLLRNGGDYYSQTMVIGNGGQLFNETLYGLIKFIFQRFFVPAKTEPSDVNLSLISNGIPTYYSIFAITIFIISLYFIFREKNITINFINVSLLLIILPFVSASYKLLLLTVSLILVINFIDLALKRNRILFAVLIIICIPKHYIWFQLEFDQVGITLESLINPILMLYLLLHNFYHSKTKVLKT